MMDRSANIIAILTDKLQSLTDQLERTNRFNEEQQKKLQDQPVNIREQEAAQSATVRKPHIRLKGGQPPSYQRVTSGEQLSLDELSPPDAGDIRLPPPFDDGSLDEVDVRLPPPSSSWPPRPRPRSPRPPKASFRKLLGQQLRQSYAQGGARTDELVAQNLLRANNASMPPDTTGGASGDPNNPMGANSAVMPWLFMPESMHGAPQFVRQLAVGSWATRQSMQWGQSAGAQLIASMQNPNSIGGRIANRIPGVNQGTVNAATNLMGTLAQHPYATYFGGRMIGKISGSLSNARDIGEILGYSSGATRNILGFNNPLSYLPTNDAAAEGIAYNIEKQRLMGRILWGGGGFGLGLSKQQSTDIMDVLGRQGWQQSTAHGGFGGMGNATTIAQQLMGPTIRAFPGLTAQDVGQFVPQLRYAAASTKELRVALGDLGNIARSTNRTIGEVTGAINDYAQATSAQGGMTIGGLTAAREFMQASGMDPSVLAGAVQSPLVQAFGLQQGIMPWALGGAGTGAFGSTLGAVKMLSGALAPMARDYTDQYGVKHSGLPNMAMYIANQTGQPYQSVLAELQHPQQFQANNKALAMMGDYTTRNQYANILQGYGAIDFDASGRMITKDKTLNAAQKARLNQIWSQQIDPVLSADKGIFSAQRIKQLDAMGPVERLTAAQKDITSLTGHAMNTPLTKAKETTNSNVSVQVGFTPQAAQWFQTRSITQAKTATNAGSPWQNFGNYAGVKNNPFGDISGPVPSGQPGSQWNNANKPQPGSPFANR